MLDLSWRRAGHGRWIAGRTELSDHLLRRFPNATAKAGLRIRLRSGAGIPFDSLSLDALPLYLHGADEQP
ncbi:hypothetical protein, partial [uncultured Methylobacterium sp.]|uniref:hypothetical protein n=1 Tax=uncultured Methylobacterium sp. TaxID=157278 RepID=UPI0025980C96